jgi:hypothetical protein
MDDIVTFSSHPIAKLKIGRFQFDKGIMRLAPDEAEESRALLQTQPKTLAMRVRETGIVEAERIAKSFATSTMKAGIDTTANSIEAQAAFDGKHPGASKDKLTDGSAEPERGPVNDKIDEFDGDSERKAERNAEKQEPLQASGGTSGSDPDATAESVAAEETAKNAAMEPRPGLSFAKPKTEPTVKAEGEVIKGDAE